MFGLGPSKSDRAFYAAFESHAKCIVEATRLLESMMKSPKDAEAIGQKVHDAEHAGDKITHDTIARLHKTWITPIDRADIHSLITCLDDVLDLTEAVSERVALYKIQECPDFAMELTNALVRAVEAIDKAVHLLPQVKQPKEMLDLCVEINRIENEADHKYRRALATLFEGGFDALYVMKWRDIIENLESATDRCEDVANVLEGIVLEYA
jgi:uncharacterized protein